MVTAPCDSPFLPLDLVARLHAALVADGADIAMARTGDPNSATAQFFVNVVDNSRLDASNSADGLGYTVFGQVTQGMDVIDNIVKVPTTTITGTSNAKPKAMNMLITKPKYASMSGAAVMLLGAKLWMNLNTCPNTK